MATSDAPTVYLAHLPGGAPCNGAILHKRQDGTKDMASVTGKVIPPRFAPPLLVSYAFIDEWLRDQHRAVYRLWCLDSGAFGVWKSGRYVDLATYCQRAGELFLSDRMLSEVFALDVIGDWRASVRNAETMWRAGVPAIPKYHLGDPEDVLVALARDYPKIALGGMVGAGASRKRAFCEWAFTKLYGAGVWPKAVHGFGVGSQSLILALPWHSVDATNWQLGPSKYGRWASFGGAKLRIRGSTHDLRSEIIHYHEIERLARHRWRRDMEVVGAQLRAAGWRGYEAPATTGDGRAR